MPLTLDEAIARVPQWAEVGDLKTSPLGGGITNHNYRVDTGGESFVMRIVGARTDLLGIDRENEYLANLAAGKAGIAPEVVYFIRPEGYLVTRFLEARPLPPEEIKHPENLRAVARLLTKIHNLPPIPGEFSVFQIVPDYSKVALRYETRFPANFDWLLEHLDEANTAFQRVPLPKCLCHNDLLNENFLFAERIYLLDWEYAGMGDIFFDLANFSVNHGLSDDEDRLFLTAYFGELDEKRWAKLKIMKILSDFREAMWGLVQTGISDLDFDFQAYADKHFTRMANNIRDPRWGQWLSILKG